MRLNLVNLFYLFIVYLFTILGSYRACDHDFVVKTDDVILDTEVNFESPPMDSFQIKQRPTFDWSGLLSNDSYVLLMLDVGFGSLKYLSVDFPRATRVIFF